MNRALVQSAVVLAAETAAAWVKELSPRPDEPWDPVRSRALDDASDTHARLRDLLRDLEVGS
jgi:hypothetical protein